MKKYALCVILIIVFLSGILSESYATCNLPSPLNLKLKNQTSCSVDVSWKQVNGASYYIVEYRIAGSGIWNLSNHLTGTSVTIYGLNANTTYEFAVASFCSDNSTSGYSPPLLKITKECTTPFSVSASSISSSAALISWVPLCGSNLFNLQYRKQGTTNWTKISGISANNYSLNNLLSGTAYEFRVQTKCGAVKSAWSAIQVFITVSETVPKKNILLFLVDDGRYDHYTVNGGPSWFNTPAISSIANEGVNFRIMIPTTSQCSPSRAAIYTGLYGHITGVEQNGDTLSHAFPIIQQILRDHGYYTGFVGKVGQYLGEPRGFDWWATSENDVFENPQYKINGNDTVIQGHISNVYPELAKTFLNSVPANKNFALFYFTRVPHYPTLPRDEDTLLYAGEELPFPDNNYFFEGNYPSFYEGFIWDVNPPKVYDLILETFQSLKGAEDNMDTLRSWLERNGVLDSTLIIYTSDNGFIMGEHRMDEKILALEESIRLPLFIRYPKWFPANTVITDEIASNIDITKTLLEFAGIEDTFGMHGLSLRQLAQGETHRKYFLYETGYDPIAARLRAVRTLGDIFIRSYCKPELCEEYYDLTVDQKQDSNLIFKPEYASTIASRRTLLDSLREAFNDPEPKKKACTFITGGSRVAVFNQDEAPEIELSAIPNPASLSFSVYFNSHINMPATLTIYNELGQLKWSKSYLSSYKIAEEIDCNNWNSGFHYLKAEQAGKVYTLKIMVER